MRIQVHVTPLHPVYFESVVFDIIVWSRSTGLAWTHNAMRQLGLSPTEYNVDMTVMEPRKK